MLLPGHLAAGYLVTKGLLELAQPAITPVQMNELLIVGTALAGLVDLDLVPLFLRNRSIKLIPHTTHKTFFTHAPLFWLILGLLVALVGQSLFAQYLGTVIALSPLSHFVLDSLGGSIMWLWPFSNRRFGFLVFPEESFERGDSTASHFSRVFREVYIKHPVFWVEIILVTLAVVSLL